MLLLVSVSVLVCHVYMCIYVCVCVCVCVCVQGVGVYIGEHVFESGIAHTDEWEECLGWQRGALEHPGLIFFWHLCSGMISFLGKPCPVGRSGGWRGTGSGDTKAHAAQSAPTTPVRWNKHGGQKRHLPMLYNPVLSPSLRHAAVMEEQSVPRV